MQAFQEVLSHFPLMVPLRKTGPQLFVALLDSWSFPIGSEILHSFLDVKASGAAGDLPTAQAPASLSCNNTSKGLWKSVTLL